MTVRRWTAVAALLTGSLLVSAGSARADAIDEALTSFKGARSIFLHLQDKKYKNVGVLRFQVQKGTKDPTFHADYLNDLMATRLENALIFTQPTEEGKQIGITRGATETAGKKDKKATFTTPEGRAKLFQHQYDQAWGDKKIKVDAFVTGLIHYASDYKSVRVVVYVFDASNPEKFTKVTQLKDIPVDRSALRDAGKSFVLTKRTFKFPDADEGGGTERIESKVTSDPGAVTKDALEKFKEYLDVEIVQGDKWEGKTFVGETPVKLVATEDGADVEGMVPGKMLAFKLTAKKELGLCLTVNGLNSVNRDAVESGSIPLEHSWWVLAQDEVKYVRGFFTRSEGKKGTLDPFLVVLPGEEKATDLGPDSKAHKFFELSIFTKSEVVGLDPKARFFEKVSDPLRHVESPKKSLELVKRGIKTKSSLAKRMFVSSGPSGEVNIESTEFDGLHVGTLRIRYFKDEPAE